MPLIKATAALHMEKTADPYSAHHNIVAIHATDKFTRD